ncbi:DNA-binding CsgD family transcriptional regulator [Mycetocola sp. CAN_C7]|uniref:ATP-binding protein n=1 Tax=Mycetocola sp. CAN_C7 TaxID=2787724 RepID=UPI0018CA73AC
MTSPAASPSMIGRESELTELRSALAGVLLGIPRGVVVSGEAGIGKTRLFEEFLVEASRDAIVVSGQCVDLGAVGAPYAPIKGVMRGLVDEIGAEALLEAGGPGRDALTALLPELGDATVDRNAGLNRLHETVAVVLETVSLRSPIVVVIEDLHWADDATLNLLRFLLRVLNRGPILLLLSFRTEDVPRGHPLRGLVSELERSRSVARIDLQRLGRSDVRRQVQEILGGLPDDEAFDSVFSRSEGIPFFVEELVGFDETCEGDLPWTLRELLLARYERLSDEAQHLLRLLSAGGVRVGHDLLVTVYDGDASVLDRVVREAVLANILVADERSYAFRHALVREAIHADLLPGERTRFHTRFAEALEAVTDHRRVATEISYHWLSAHDAAKAFPASLRAMVEARATYAYGSAAQMGERALELWDQVPDAESVANRKKVDLIAQTASALRNAGEEERALAMVNLALAECPRDDALRYARLLRDKAMYLGNSGRPGSITLLREALELVPSGSTGLAGTSGLAGTTLTAAELRSALLTGLAGRLMIEGRFVEAKTVAREGLDEAQAAGSDRHASIASNIYGAALIDAGEIDEGHVHLDNARRLAENDTSAMLRYRVNASDAEYLLGHYATALQIAELGIARAHELGVERSSGIILQSNAVDPLIALGEWDRADHLVDRALTLLPSAVFNAYLQRARIFLMLWRGDVDGAARLYRSLRAGFLALAHVEMQVTLGHARLAAELALARNDPEQAWSDVSVLLGPEHRMYPGYDLPLLATAARVLAVLRSGDSGLAAREDATAEARMRELATDLAFWPTSPVWLPVFEAELSGADGDGQDPDAWRLAGEAIAGDAAAPAHLHSYALLRTGRAHAEAGDRASATASLQAAVAEAGLLGAGLISTEAAAVAARAGIALDGQPMRQTRDAAELTARERQVLELIAQGLSNRQIGEQLFISAKTASVHVSAILRKLGASTRTEAAFLARELVTTP